MLDTNTLLPARSLQKSYKAILASVKTNRRTVVLTTNNRPQAALISLEDLEELRRLRGKRANLELLKLAINNKEELKSLPANLREKANEIIYSQ